jgi:hypothetical protein
MAKFKVRRDLLAMKAETITGGVTASSTVAVTLGMTAASTLAVTGGITGSSTLTVGGTTTIGADKTKLAALLAGSLSLTVPAINASTAGTVAGCIPGMSSAGSLYKIFITQQSGGASLLLTGIAASDSAEGLVTFTYFNASDADEAATAATTISYVAVLDSA